MLIRLLELRRLRERALRVQLDAVRVQREALQTRMKTLLVQRQHLQHGWRRCGMTDAVLDQAAWRQFRAALADYSQRDTELGNLLDIQEQEERCLLDREADLQSQLRRVLTGQQKLQALLA